MNDANGTCPNVDYPQIHLAVVDIGVVSEESEIDFDDEREEDQMPLDVIEPKEVGVLLDDSEELSAKGVGS